MATTTPNEAKVTYETYFYRFSVLAVFLFTKLLFLGENEKLMNNVKLYRIDCEMMLFISSFAHSASFSRNIRKFRDRVFP